MPGTLSRFPEFWLLLYCSSSSTRIETVWEQGLCWRSSIHSFSHMLCLLHPTHRPSRLGLCQSCLPVLTGWALLTGNASRRLDWGGVSWGIYSSLGEGVTSGWLLALTESHKPVRRPLQALSPGSISYFFPLPLQPQWCPLWLSLVVSLHPAYTFLNQPCVKVHSNYAMWACCLISTRSLILEGPGLFTVLLQSPGRK